jgi:hypothetical protein
MSYGDNGGAVGYLVGEENRGLACMFTMMNLARLSVGLQGVGIAERATQQALRYARERKQGHAIGGPGAGSSAIIDHPDVKRMLMTMRALTRAARSICYATAGAIDGSHRKDDNAEAADERAALLTPVAKAFSTDIGIEVASLGIQVHGGMGYVEETGAAQPYRDVRISSIYEGTTGIQANDLLNRKLSRDQGMAMKSLLAEATHELEAIQTNDVGVRSAKAAAIEALAATGRAAGILLKSMMNAPADAYAVSIPFLKLCGFALGGWLQAKSAAIAERKLAAGDMDRQFLEGKIASARFYADHILPQTLALARIVEQGSGSVVETNAELI